MVPASLNYSKETVLTTQGLTKGPGGSQGHLYTLLITGPTSVDPNVNPKAAPYSVPNPTEQGFGRSPIH